MDDLENGLNEKRLIDFVKTVLLSGDNPRGEEALNNLKWGIKQYRKHLILPVVGVRSEQLCQHDNQVTNRICDDCGQTITYVPD